MAVLITGASSGIGAAIVSRFLSDEELVIGVDIRPAPYCAIGYQHICADIRDPISIDPEDVHILINNAGIQTTGVNQWEDIDVNLKALIDFTERYGLQPKIQAIVNIASTAAHNGAEFPVYAASKGGVLAYTKNVAQRVAQFGATCNSISPGGVYTLLNKHIMDDPELMSRCYDETLLHKWATPEEIADWVYFVSVNNKSMTGQDIL